MAKVTLTDITGLSTANVVEAIWANQQAIQAAIETLLSRNGTAPNAMTSALDMNSQRLINLPQPSAGTDAARLQDVSAALSGSSNLALVTALNTTTSIPLANWVRFGGINVKSFGAVGDGVADDADAIEAAIALSNTTNESIYFPDGSYYTSRTLDFTKYSSGTPVVWGGGGKRVYGDSYGSVYITTDDAAVSPLIADYGGGIYFQDFSFTNTNATKSDVGLSSPMLRGGADRLYGEGFVKAIDHTGALSSHIRNCRFTNCTTAIYNINTSPGFSNIVEYAFNYTDTCQYGYDLKRVWQLRMMVNATEYGVGVETSARLDNCIVTLDGNWSEGQLVGWQFINDCVVNFFSDRTDTNTNAFGSGTLLAAVSGGTVATTNGTSFTSKEGAAEASNGAVLEFGCRNDVSDAAYVKKTYFDVVKAAGATAPTDFIMGVRDGQSTQSPTAPMDSLSGIGSTKYPLIRYGKNYWYPGADNTIPLGSLSYRWTEVFATNGTINTSDVREKNLQFYSKEWWYEVTETLDDLETIIFRWNDLRDTGLHAGFAAQTVAAKLAPFGLHELVTGLYQEDSPLGLRYVELLSLLRQTDKIQRTVGYKVWLVKKKLKALVLTTKQKATAFLN